MRAVMKTGLVALLGASSWIVSPQPGMTQGMVRAYALIETEQGSNLPDALGGLMNCKGLTTSWVSTEVVAYIECNDLNSLNEAMGTIPELDGVRQTTLWSIKRIE